MAGQGDGRAGHRSAGTASHRRAQQGSPSLDACAIPLLVFVRSGPGIHALSSSEMDFLYQAERKLCAVPVSTVSVGSHRKAASTKSRHGGWPCRIQVKAWRLPLQDPSQGMEAGLARSKARHGGWPCRNEWNDASDHLNVSSTLLLPLRTNEIVPPSSALDCPSFSSSFHLVVQGGAGAR